MGLYAALGLGLRHALERRLALLWALCAAAWLAASPAPPVGAEVEPRVSPAQRNVFISEIAAEGAALLSRQYLTGDWGGLRSKLLDLGITPTLTFVTDVLGNPVGGVRQGLRETDNWGLDVLLDLERLVGWTGARFDTSFSLRSGTSLTTDDVGNIFNVAQLCCSHTHRLVNVYLEQSLLGDAVNVRVGRLAAADDFLTSPLYWNFVQTGIDGNPVGIFLNVPMSSYPVATWGARVRVKPVEWMSVMAGVYNGDPTLGDNDKHGVDWSMRGPLFAIAEIGFRLNQGAGATGFPGNYKVGGFYDSGDFPDFFTDVQGGSAVVSGLPARQHHGNGGFYFLLDQMVYRDGGPGSQRGLVPFVSLVVSPDQSTNPMPFFVNGGLVYRGPLDSRPRDQAALGVMYGAFSNQLQRSPRDAQRNGVGAEPQRYELALELTYILQATRWLQVQPDVQYIINPGGTGKIRDALVIGFQLAINL